MPEKTKPASYTLCVFCGSSSGGHRFYADAAQALGVALALRGWGLMYGGGHIGLMGILADAVLQEGSPVVGVIPRAMVDKELAHRGLTELHIVDTMHERKAMMAERSDGFLALPGGFGTADEFFEILTWRQLGLHHKPIGLLNLRGYYDSMLAWLDHSVREGFVNSDQLALLVQSANVDDLLTEMEGLMDKSKP